MGASNHRKESLRESLISLLGCTANGSYTPTKKTVRFFRANQVGQLFLVLASLLSVRTEVEHFKPLFAPHDQFVNRNITCNILVGIKTKHHASGGIGIHDN